MNKYMQTFFEIVQEENFTAVALGFFDGIHMGHRKVLSSAVAEKQNGLLPLCFTFEQSPKSVISGQATESIVSYDTKLELMENMGIEHLYMCDFKAYMDIEPEDFVEKILIGKLKAKKLFCGFNYRFGKQGRGDTAMLSQICKKHGAEVCVVSPVEYEGEVVSSTLIRALIKDGEIARANTLLCSHYGFSAEIISGRRLGRTLDTPTMNQKITDGLIVPKFGVYASVVTLSDGSKYCGVTNIGIKPTVGGEELLSETWMPDYCGGEIYGEIADVRLLEFIRPEKKFSSLEELRTAIIDNGKTAKEIYKEYLEKNNEA